MNMQPDTLVGLPDGDPLTSLEPEQIAAVARSVLVVILHRKSEGVAAPLLTAAGAWGWWGAPFAPMEDSWGGVMDVTRANIARTFMQYASERPDIRFLCMIDNDEEIAWSAPYRLALWDLPVVTGVVCSYGTDRGIYANFSVADSVGISHFPSTRYTKRLPGKGIRKVVGAGGGLLCIRKDVFAAIDAGRDKLLDAGLGESPFEIPASVRRESFETGTLKQSEDTAFSKQCAALGIDIYVDFAVRAKHFKVLPVEWPRDLIDENLDARNWQVDARDYHHGE